MCCFGLYMNLQKDVAREENNSDLTEGSWPRIQDKGTFALQIFLSQAVLTSAAKYGYWHLCVSCHCWLFKLFVYCRLGSKGAALGCSTGLVGFQRGIFQQDTVRGEKLSACPGCYACAQGVLEGGLESRTKAFCKEDLRIWRGWLCRLGRMRWVRWRLIGTMYLLLCLNSLMFHSAQPGVVINNNTVWYF